jgi:hypothetical protein
MGVRIDESGKHNLAFAIDFNDGRAILLQPRIAERIFAGTDGNNLSSQAEHGSVFNHAHFIQVDATAGT